MKSSKLTVVAARRRLLLLFLVPILFLVTLKTHRTYSASGDEPHYLLIAESLWDDGDLRMENQYPDRHLFLPQYPPSEQVVPTPDGGLFPVHDIGLPVMMLPLLAIAHVVVPRIPPSIVERTRMELSKITTTLFSYQSMLVTGLLAMGCFFLFRRRDFEDGEAFWVALLAVLTTPIAAFGYLFFTEIYSAAILVAATILLTKERTPLRSALLSLAVFALSWLHIKNLVLALALCVLWARSDAWRSRRIGMRIVPLAAFSLAVVLRIALNGYYFHHLSIAGPWGGVPLSLANAPTSFIALLFDREYGLLFANPLFWLLPLGVVLLWKMRSAWFRTEGILVVSYATGIVLFSWWWAGWAPAVRHLMPIIPLLWLPVGTALTALCSDSSAARRVVGGFLLASTVISALLWQYPKCFWFNHDGINRWMDLLTIGNYRWQSFLPSFSVAQEHRASLVAIWVVVIAGMNAALYWRFLRNRSHVL